MIVQLLLMLAFGDRCLLQGVEAFTIPQAFQNSLPLTSSSQQPSSSSSSKTSWKPHCRSISTLRQQNKVEDFYDIPAEKSVVAPVKTQRRIIELKKYARLPVWPAWNGAILFVLSKFLPPEVIGKLEDQFGGRVCPNFFSAESTSPFLLLVHHCHSFFRYDPLRLFQKSYILPEGFPSHPHRGFITLTYCLRGGMLHRDSLGCKQKYGADDDEKDKYDGNVAQWLSTGAGLLHEEMWDIESDKITSHQELYQLWINVPSSEKMKRPSISLLNDVAKKNKVSSYEGDEIYNNNGAIDSNVISFPTVISESGNTFTKVLVGEYNGERSGIEPATPMSILHVQMKPTKDGSASSWSITLPSTFQTAMIYMRTGSAYLPSSLTSGQESDKSNKIPVHYTAVLSSSGEELTIETKTGADFLLLAGEPILQPVETQGSMVMNTPAEIERAYMDYSMGKMGKPWDEALSDEEWLDHVSKAGSIY